MSTHHARTAAPGHALGVAVLTALAILLGFLGAGPAGASAPVTEGPVTVWGYDVDGQTAVPAGLGAVTGVSAGVWHSLALRGDGTVAAWGENSAGQTTVPQGLSGVSAVAAGGWHSLAVRRDGTVVAWGDDSRGQARVPAGLADVTAVSAGLRHSLALRADGTVAAWGDDSHGQLGVPAGLTDVVAISAGGLHSLALRADGSVVAWGRDSDGQASVPAAVRDVKAVAAGGLHNLALLGDGSVVGWGNDVYEQASAPDDLTGVTAVAAGGWHSLALRSDGTVVAWGDDFFGQATVPEQLGEVRAVAAGGDHSLALRRIVAPPAAPAEVRARKASSSSADVTFVPARDEGSSPVTAFQAQCTSTDGGTTRSATGAAGPLTVTRLSTGHSYRCRVRAVNADATGGWSAHGKPFAVLPTAPGEPQRVTAAVGSPTSATVSFSPPASDGARPVTGYTVQCVSDDGGSSRTASAATSPRTFGNLSTGHTYRCRARATNEVGAGAWSSFGEPFVPAVVAPGAPQRLTAGPAGPTSAAVEFRAPVSDGGSAITGYTAQCASVDGGTARSASGAASPRLVTGLTAGHTYRCRVRAVSGAGAGAWTAYSDRFVPVAVVPGAPQVVVATPTSASAVEVSFYAPAWDGGSRVTAYQAQCASSDGGTTRSSIGETGPLDVLRLTPGAGYRCRARAVNEAGAGPWSPYGDVVGPAAAT